LTPGRGAQPGASEPISPAAIWVHGIRDADAPPLAEVELLAVTRGRTVIAYNAAFDAGRIVQHAARNGLDPARFGTAETWAPDAAASPGLSDHFRPPLHADRRCMCDQSLLLAQAVVPASACLGGRGVTEGGIHGGLDLPELLGGHVRIDFCICARDTHSSAAAGDRGGIQAATFRAVSANWPSVYRAGLERGRPGRATTPLVRPRRRSCRRRRKLAPSSALGRSWAEVGVSC
jgi:hypothetical protein